MKADSIRTTANRFLSKVETQVTLHKQFPTNCLNTKQISMSTLPSAPDISSQQAPDHLTSSSLIPINRSRSSLAFLKLRSASSWLTVMLL